jgi:leader peptidase (prepilin peptidase) / N-methyltransferase
MGLLVSLLFYIKVPNNFLELDAISQGLLSADLGFGSFIIVTLVTVLITDIKTGLIPDRITFPSVIISFFYLLISAIVKAFIFYQSLASHELGRYLLPKHSYEYLFLWNYFLPSSDQYFFIHANMNFQPFISGVISAFALMLFFASLIIVTRGRGMGGGDLKLSIFLGLVFGFPKSLLAVMLGFLTGSVVGIALLILRRKHFGQTIPFGPFLSIGGLITLYWGDKILNWYLNLSVY